MRKTVLSLMLLIVSFFFANTVEAKSLSLDSYNSNMEYSVLANEFETNRKDDFTGNCADFATTIRMGGYIILVVKILLPIIIIVKASMSFFSVVTSGKEDELKKKATNLVYSLIAAIIIFFVPRIVDVLFGFVNEYATGKTDDSKICVACVFDPMGETCTEYAE